MIAELTAEMKIKDAVMQEKGRFIQSNIAALRCKDELLQLKDAALHEKESLFGELIKCKDVIIEAKDAEILRLHADLARSSAEGAAGGAAPHPAPARAAAAADEAVRLYRLAAAQGDARGQCNLGFMFENGRGVAKKKSEAIRLYRLSAAHGHAPATAALNRLRA
jgi:hypothetical protein